jgi:hypothetical protein
MSKTKKIILVTALIAVFISSICVPVSAIVSGDSELSILDSSTAYMPGNASSEVFANTMNFDSYSSASFQMRSQGMYEINLKFNFSSSHTYGTIRLLITSNNSEATSNLVSNPTYQGVFVNGSKKTEADGWHYGHVNAYTVEIIYKGYMPSNFNVVSYYNCSQPINAYLVSTYEFTPIDKGTQDIIDNQNSNTQAEIEADRDNTQSIIDNQNQLAEQEKNEIQQSGDEATEGAENVPNQSDGFINALDNLVSALSYNGTECKWTLPQVKMPQIANIVPEMVLIEQQDIDFGVWVQKMPSNILSLIQAVCTGALIVYCFKELYGTISYVFTLKGGGE